MPKKQKPAIPPSGEAMEGAAGWRVSEKDGLPPHQIIMFYVYILKSKKDGQCYAGSTNDLKNRFKEHNSGEVFSTKARRPFELVYYEAYKAKQDARNREKSLKLRSRAFAQLKKRIYESLQ